MSRPPLRIFRTLAAPAVVTLALSAPAAFAQATAPGTGGRAGDPKAQARPASVVGCTSLANLRSLLRSAGEDRAAALALATDPKSDLGCSPVDRAAVMGLADHVALNGRAYDCLTLKGTAVCHWTVAGAVTPPERPAAKPPRANAGGNAAGKSGGAGSP
ncbi:Secreted protein [Methylorubrum thiocyanatum]